MVLRIFLAHAYAQVRLRGLGIYVHVTRRPDVMVYLVLMWRIQTAWIYRDVPVYSAYENAGGRVGQSAHVRHGLRELGLAIPTSLC